MPCCSTASTARALISSSLTSLPASSSRSSTSASFTVTRRCSRFCWPMLENRLCSWLVISSIPGGVMMSMPWPWEEISISISLSSSWPSRSFLRKVWRVLLSSRGLSSWPRGGGSRASSTRSSAASAARWPTSSLAYSRTILIAASIRSRIIDSTSRPT